MLVTTWKDKLTINSLKAPETIFLVSNSTPFFLTFHNHLICPVFQFIFHEMGLITTDGWLIVSNFFHFE